MNEIDVLVEISRYAGERFDLIQAGGGNSSVKVDDKMLIKASGFLLSDVSKSSGYVKVSLDKLEKIFDNKEILTLLKKEKDLVVANLIKEATLGTLRASIETLMHALLSKYVLHTHPIVVNMIVAKKDWEVLLKEIFKDQEILLVEYKTPGIELAMAIKEKIDKHKKAPKIIFLQNHGLIVHSDNKDEIKSLTELVVTKIESYLDIDMSRFRLVSDLRDKLKLFFHEEFIIYLSEDLFLNQILQSNKSLFFKKPFFPDMMVYCGISACEAEKIESFKKLYNEFPKVLIYKDRLFFIANNLKKAKEMEEVMKAHVMVLNTTGIEINSLLDEELFYLREWEAERYRQKI